MSIILSMFGWFLPNHGKFLKTLIIIIVLGAIGFGIYYGLAQTNKKAASPVASKNTGPITSQIKINSSTVSYISDNLDDGFSYPTGWTVTDTIGSDEITVTSPMLNLINSANKLVKGQISMVINQNQQPTLSGFKNGNAVAALESQIINYATPSPEQPGSAYISFLTYAGPENSISDIGGIYITGNLGYMPAQAIPEPDIYQVSPIVYIDFSQCVNDVCKASDPALNIPVSMWNLPAFQNHC